jgi:hypothetical protein
MDLKVLASVSRPDIRVHYLPTFRVLMDLSPVTWGVKLEYCHTGPLFGLMKGILISWSQGCQFFCSSGEVFGKSFEVAALQLLLDPSQV